MEGMAETSRHPFFTRAPGRAPSLITRKEPGAMAQGPPEAVKIYTDGDDWVEIIYPYPPARLRKNWTSSPSFNFVVGSFNLSFPLMAKKARWKSAGPLFPSWGGIFGP